MEKIILGIDPGTMVMGFGLIEVKNNKIKLITLDELLLHKLPNQQTKLKKIFEKILAIIDQYHPDELAIEAQFFGVNVQSMLKLGRAQGVCIAACLHRDMPVTEYAPKKVKMAITGNGNASKEQVAGMLQHLLGLKEIPKRLDATDGLAVAVCHHLNSGKTSSSSTKTTKSSSSWDAFVKNNPNRTK